MLIIRDSLHTIHKQFFLNIQPVFLISLLFLILQDVNKVEIPVGEVIKQIRSHLFKGRVLYFDSLENKV